MESENKDSVLLLIMGWIFHLLQQLDFGKIYDYCFKGLSILSVLLVVIINISKIVHYYKKKKETKNNPK